MAALYDLLHSVEVYHSDVEERHVIGPQADLREWQVIDFDDARGLQRTKMPRASSANGSCMNLQGILCAVVFATPRSARD